MHRLAQQHHDLAVVQLVETPYDLQDRNIVCYPNLLLLFEIEVPRLFLQPRTVYSAVTVDLVKGDAARSNMFPESADIEISTAALIPRLVTNAAAIEAARKLVLRWLRHKYKVYKSPRIDVIKQQEVYKAFFYTQNHKGEDILVDSVRGIKLLDND